MKLLNAQGKTRKKSVLTHQQNNKIYFRKYNVGIKNPKGPGLSDSKRFIKNFISTSQFSIEDVGVRQQAVTRLIDRDGGIGALKINLRLEIPYGVETQAHHMAEAVLKRLLVE